MDERARQMNQLPVLDGRPAISISLNTKLFVVFMCYIQIMLEYRSGDLFLWPLDHSCAKSANLSLYSSSINATSNHPIDLDAVQRNLLDATPEDPFTLARADTMSINYDDIARCFEYPVDYRDGQSIVNMEGLELCKFGIQFENARPSISLIGHFNLACTRQWMKVLVSQAFALGCLAGFLMTHYLLNIGAKSISEASIYGPSRDFGSSSSNTLSDNQLARFSSVVLICWPIVFGLCRNLNHEQPGELGSGRSHVLVQMLDDTVSLNIQYTMLLVCILIRSMLVMMVACRVLINWLPALHQDGRPLTVWQQFKENHLYFVIFSLTFTASKLLFMPIMLKLIANWSVLNEALAITALLPIVAAITIELSSSPEKLEHLLVKFKLKKAPNTETLTPLADWQPVDLGESVQEEEEEESGDSEYKNYAYDELDDNFDDQELENNRVPLSGELIGGGHDVKGRGSSGGLGRGFKTRVSFGEVDTRWSSSSSMRACEICSVNKERIFATSDWRRQSRETNMAVSHDTPNGSADSRYQEPRRAQEFGRGTSSRSHDPQDGMVTKEIEGSTTMITKTPARASGKCLQESLATLDFDAYQPTTIPIEFNGCDVKDDEKFMTQAVEWPNCGQRVTALASDVLEQHQERHSSPYVGRQQRQGRARRRPQQRRQVGGFWRRSETNTRAKHDLSLLELSLFRWPVITKLLLLTCCLTYEYFLLQAMPNHKLSHTESIESLMKRKLDYRKLSPAPAASHVVAGTTRSPPTTTTTASTKTGQLAIVGLQQDDKGLVHTDPRVELLNGGLVGKTNKLAIVALAPTSREQYMLAGEQQATNNTDSLASKASPLTQNHGNGTITSSVQLRTTHKPVNDTLEPLATIGQARGLVYELLGGKHLHNATMTTVRPFKSAEPNSSSPWVMFDFKGLDYATRTLNALRYSNNLLEIMWITSALNGWPIELAVIVLHQARFTRFETTYFKLNRLFALVKSGTVFLTIQWLLVAVLRRKNHLVEVDWLLTFILILARFVTTLMLYGHLHMLFRLAYRLGTNKLLQFNLMLPTILVGLLLAQLAPILEKVDLIVIPISILACNLIAHYLASRIDKRFKGLLCPMLFEGTDDHD